MVFKKNPPREYFWKVYVSVEINAFKERYDENLDRILHKIRRPQAMAITEEHRRLLNEHKQENMRLTLALKKTGVAKNIIYLKKVVHHTLQKKTIYQ